MPPNLRPPHPPILRQVRLVILLLGFGIAFIEILTHYLQYGFHLDIFLFIEAGIYAIFIPLVLFLLLNRLQSLEQGRLQAFEVLNHQLAVSRRFAQSPEWNELIWWIAEYPTTLLPIQRVVLYVQNLQTDALELAAVWSEGRTIPAELEQAASPFVCEHCQAGQFNFHTLKSANLTQNPAETWYCLPLPLGETRVGLIQMAGAGSLPENGMQILINTSPEIALAVDRARLKRVAQHQALSNEEERKQIARDLHDTLGQSVAFLRLRLERLAKAGDPARQIGEIRNELEMMREAADEAYHQVRETLADLRSDTPRHLSLALGEMSQAIAARSGFQVNWVETGQPITLSAHTRRQILYICREALYNIEKHANARQVAMQLDWQESTLSIQIQDDGVGFSPTEVDGNLHYGLSIMKDRAEEMEARLTMDSKPGAGARIHLQVPISSPTLARESITLPIVIHGSEKQNDEIVGG